MINVAVKDLEIQFHERTHLFSFRKGETAWEWREGCLPRLAVKGKEIRFADALHITHERFAFGAGEGIRSRYECFELEGAVVPYTFETSVWAEYATGNVYCEWIPVREEGLDIKAVYWPGEMEFDAPKQGWYTLLNEGQGILIPNTWKEELEPLKFNGLFGTAGGYMPWISQVKDRAGYLAVCVTPWNAGYQAEHPAGGPYTHVGIRLEPSLGKMDYRRIVRYTFLEDCDYNDVCKEYRAYARQTGLLCTLREKAAKTPSVDKLIGCAFVHQGIKTSVREDSDFYDSEAPDKNNHLTTFAEREEGIRVLHEKGVEKLYLHLDGWAEPGYDNLHPDYAPVCKAAGGREGMKHLSDTMRELGYLFGIHDQYRDYYHAAPSYEEEYACHLPDGSIPSHRRWAGGPQSYLCGTQAPYYVRRNFTRLREQEIHLDGAYLDVFTCNEGDECSSLRHRMTRRECYDYRNQCFEYLLSLGILPSSEEVSDWCMGSLVFCHYAPYEFMLKKPGSSKMGIPVPLYNLVYHDCMIEPWMMECTEEEDYMLYALLNGGAPYLIRDGAYPDCDGSFGKSVECDIDKSIERSRIVSKLHEKVAKCEMLRHTFMGDDWKTQQTVFSDGTTVTVDFSDGTYHVEDGMNC